MAKAPIDIRSLARKHTTSAINTLAGIMTSSDAPPAARVSAASTLLDRGWGKATQPISGGDDEDSPIKIISRIERVIVKPKPTENDGEDGDS